MRVSKFVSWQVAGNHRLLGEWQRIHITHILLLAFLLLLTACAQQPAAVVEREPVQIQIAADSQTIELTTISATTVREALAEAGIILNDADEITPPLFTPIDNNTIALEITVVRISESIEIIPRSLPFERKLVRNEAMDADEPSRIIQAGQDGLQEETVRIVYRDGLETERWVTQTTIIEPAQDEIVMVGVGAARGNISFSGTLAYISGGNSVLLRGLSAFPESLKTGDGLDGRVFTLSPSGSHLLYTRVTSDTTSFNNSLWIIATERGAEPWRLEVDNVLWAGWDPSQAETLRIAYTTANSTNLPPGWEANNDLWLGDIVSDPEANFQPEQLIESYPATYGWWGGNFAWSPQGSFIAYSHANEVGVIDIETVNVDLQRRQLQQFTEYNTRSDWVWVPTLTWSPNGRFLAFTNHDSSDPEELAFSSWAVDVELGVNGRFVLDSGMWAHLHWNPAGSEIAFLKATDPLDSQRSSYALWLIDGDGSNGRRLYPPPGELTLFPREQSFMTWGPDGQEMAFIFDDGLYIFELGTEEARLISQDDATASHPTWAPFGAGISSDLLDDPEEPPLPFQNGAGQFIPDN